MANQLVADRDVSDYRMIRESPELYARSLKLIKSWEKRAQVKQSFPGDIRFSPEMPDFPLDILPFDSNTWEARYGRKKIIELSSLAWIAFNNKVISIESNILIPCCKILMDTAFYQGDNVEAELLAQAQTDEAFHVLMAHKTNALCRELRSIPLLQFPETRIIKELRILESSEIVQWQKDLSLVAATVVTEVLIKGFLSPISRSDSIQVLNRHVTNMHLTDEAAHGQVFQVIAHKLLSQLTTERREYFIQQMRNSFDYFTDIDIDIWIFIIQYSEISITDEIIEELSSNQAASDYRELDKLLADHKRLNFA